MIRNRALRLLALAALALSTPGCLDLAGDLPWDVERPTGPCAHLASPGGGARVLVHVTPRADSRGGGAAPIAFSVEFHPPRVLREKLEEMGMGVTPATNITDEHDCAAFRAVAPGEYEVRVNAPHLYGCVEHANYGVPLRTLVFTDCAACPWVGTASVPDGVRGATEIDVQVRQSCEAFSVFV